MQGRGLDSMDLQVYTCMREFEGWDMENLGDGIWRLWMIGCGEFGGWDMATLEDGIWRI